MSREERIEATAKDICPLYKEYGSCERCDDELAIDDAPCIYKCMAKLFVENNYCKASDIFEEIDKLLRQHRIEFDMSCVDFYFEKHYAELKKKYKEGEG